MKKIKKFLDLLNKSEKRQIYIILTLIILTALLDMVGIASIMPFMALLSNPELINSNEYFALVFNKLNLNSNQEFLIYLGISIFVLLLFSIMIKALTTYFQIRFSMMREYSLSRKLFERYLAQPYNWFLLNNSSDLKKNILSEIHIVITHGFMPLFVIITNTTISIAIIFLLLIIDIEIAFTIGIFLSCIYLVTYKVMGKKLSQLGRSREKNNQGRFSIAAQAFGAINEIKAKGIEKFWNIKFKNTAKLYSENLTSVEIISQLPRFIFEAIAFGGVLLLILILLLKESNLETIIPIISVYVFAGYRLLPSLQMIYRSIVLIRYVDPALNSLHKSLKNLKKIKKKYFSDKLLKIDKSIKLENISYKYSDTRTKFIKNLSLNIKANSNIAFVGTTGSGKSSILFLILGLLEPNNGKILIDGKDIKKYKAEWQNSVGYVPQHIYLLDDTIEANIAFGVDKKKIDYLKLIESAKIANIHTFVINNLKYKYKTIIGENGVRLSGGQRQRLGIARALYFNPNLIVLDEATSALDNLTERKVIKSINNFRKNVTKIIVAHRLDSIKHCDQIFFIENGSIYDSGTFKELKKRNWKFREMTISQKRL